ncbi:fatty acid desaturase [Paenibacillus sp. LMG 31460]|uniref:Fatty acid desaturase n=1 Tax=Paenibacillus germinis TaxID=2654979 RepID=A0ABX1Z5S9_9BACL|nr:fatty acid desaturase family protein [Paenibacillus germinis]NOU88742.1 fatty acid desaturase [Paenibacillus germinis]
MSNKNLKRDYSLTGPENKRAQEKGLVAAEWYTSPISRKRLKELMKRKDGPAIRDTIIMFAWLIGTGILAYYSWGTWWAIPAFALYGISYASTADSRWHECGHGTAFKTAWMNDALYQIASFMDLRPPTPWRWSHARHHTDTYIVGRDPEIAMTRPPVWRIIFGEIVHIYGGSRDLKSIITHCFGKLTDSEKDYVPETEFRKAVWISRVWILILLGFTIWSIQIGSILPLMFVGLPTFYGPILLLLVGLTQHLGLHEDVLDHRLNTRTIYLNPFFRFLYWNMNYHIEHHMFPMVPYHALPALHKELMFDYPAPNPSLWAALKEVIAALIKQKKDPQYVVDRPLPSTANPYYYGVQAEKTVTSQVKSEPQAMIN